MKKEYWIKRIALVALTGLLSGSVLTACQEQEFKIVGIEDTNKKELDKDMEESQNDKTYFVPDYALLEYECFGEKQAKVVEVSKIDENTIFCQSITTPDLVATISKNGDKITCSMGLTIYPFKEMPVSNVNLETHLYAYVQQYCNPKDGLYISKEIMNKIEENYGNQRVISSVLVENANGEWGIYEHISSVTYKTPENEMKTLMMAEESNTKNQIIYRSLTIPELTLIETFSNADENYQVNYEFRIDNSEKLNENFSKQNEVISVATCIGAAQLSYEEIKEHEKINDNTNETYLVPNLVIVEYKNNGEKEAKVINLKSSHEDVTLLDFVTDSTKFYKNRKIVTITNKNGKMVLEDLGYTDIKIIDDVYSCVQQYCEFGEGLNVSYDIIKKVEEGYGNSRTIKSILAENANREWKEYYQIVKVSYVINGEQTICLMGFESDSKTERIYRSLTCPEITLVETIDENSNIVKSEIVTNSMLPEKNEELRQNAKVRKFGTYMSTHQFSYDKVLEYENQIIEEENDKIGDELLSVREKLNVSPEEDSKYANILSIGDFVNLVDDNVLVYKDRDSLKEHKNATTSLYGMSIMRCISAIDMSNGNVEVTVNNMEDYETYLNNEYFEIGYSLVNEYSMDEFENLTVEFRCDKEDVYSLGRGL